MSIASFIKINGVEGKIPGLSRARKSFECSIAFRAKYTRISVLADFVQSHCAFKISPCKLHQIWRPIQYGHCRHRYKSMASYYPEIMPHVCYKVYNFQGHRFSCFKIWFVLASAEHGELVWFYES